MERQQREVQKITKKAAVEVSMPPPPPTRKGAEILSTDPVLLMEQMEALKLRMLSLKNQETELNERKEHLESERALLVREIKRQRDERASLLHDMPILGRRYQLTNLLGRGGFSEVRNSLNTTDTYGKRSLRVVLHYSNRMLLFSTHEGF